MRALDGWKLLLPLLAAGIAWADLTITASTNVSVSPLLPTNMPLKDQLTKMLPAKSRWRVHGEKAFMEVDGSNGIIDYSKNTITLLDVPNRQYATVPLAGLTAMAESAFKRQNDVGTVRVEGMKSTATVRKTGKHEQVLDIQTEEVLLSLEMEMPNAPNLGGAMKMEMRFWLATGSEVQRVAALKEFSALAARTKSPANVLEFADQITAPFPGFGDSLRAPLKTILQGSGPALKMQLQIFSPMLKQLTDLLVLSGQKVPPGADPSGPLAEITMEFMSLSTETLDSSIFQIPVGFSPVRFGVGPGDQTETNETSQVPEGTSRPTLKRSEVGLKGKESGTLQRTTDAPSPAAK